MQFENFSFYWSCLWYRRTLPSPRSWRFFMFFSKSSTVLCFTFKPVVHFELIFYRVWLRLKVIFFFFGLWVFFYPSTICWKGYPSSIELFLNLWQNQLGILVWIYSCLLYPIPLIYPLANSTQSWLSLHDVLKSDWFFPHYSSFSKLF